MGSLCCALTGPVAANVRPPLDFGRLSGNDAINTRIYECFRIIDPRDIPKFVRKLRKENDNQRFHTFRELVFGAELATRGLKPRYEQALGSVTPDWAIYDERRIVKEIVDVVTLHPRYDIYQDIAKTVGTGAIWSGSITTAPDRLYTKLQDKFGAYSTHAENGYLAFVVALFSEFMSPINASEIDHVLTEVHGGLFRDYPQVSGLVHFEYSKGAFRFSGFANAAAPVQSEIVGLFL